MYQTFAQPDFARLTKNDTSCVSPGPKTLLGRSAHVRRPSMSLANRTSASAWALKSLVMSIYCRTHQHIFLGGGGRIKLSKKGETKYLQLNTWRRIPPGRAILSKGILRFHLHYLYHVNHQILHLQNCCILAF